MSEALSPYIIARHYIAARIARYVPCRLRYPACLTRAMHTVRGAQARLRGQCDMPSARRPLCSIRPDGQRPSPKAPASSPARNGSHAVRARHIISVPVQRMTYYTPPAGRACHALPRRNKCAARLTLRHNIHAILLASAAINARLVSRHAANEHTALSRQAAISAQLVSRHAANKLTALSHHAANKRTALSRHAANKRTALSHHAAINAQLASPHTANKLTAL